MYRNSSFLDYDCRKILCSSLIQPYLDYCSTTWYSSISKLLQNRLDIVQRRMVRFVLSKEPRYHVSREDMRSLSWLSISERVKFFKLTQVFKIRLGTAPSYLSGNFKPLSLSHTHNTRRSSRDYFISKELAKCPGSFAFTAIKHWNDLPHDLKHIRSYGAFKSRLKKHLLTA